MSTNPKYKLCFLFLATLTIPSDLPQYKKNAYTIFHQLLTWIDELSIELNIHQMQMASQFTSMQQVETRRHKEEETTEEYIRHKSLANLTKARYMKQMEKITKELKKDTPLTHNYSIPKPTNQTVLTNTLSQRIPDNIIIPDIETNIQLQLDCLGISNSLLTTIKKPNEESSQTTSLFARTRPLQEYSTTTAKSTDKLLEESLRHQSKEEFMQVSTPQDKNLQNLPMKMVDSGKQQEDNQPCPPKHIYAEISQKNKTDKLESIQEENNKSSPQEEEHEEDEVKDFDTTDDEEPATNNTKCKIQKPAKPAKLNHQQQVTEVTAYLWVHKASDSALKKMDLADETEYINILLLHNMKKLIHGKKRQKTIEKLNHHCHITYRK